MKYDYKHIKININLILNTYTTHFMKEGWKKFS